MLSRLGFPSVGRHRRFVTAIAVDAIGSGVFPPISVLYFLATTRLSLVEIGLALSIASALRLPTAPLVGTLVDRLGAKRVLLGSNILQAVGYAGYVLVDSFAVLVVVSTVVWVGQGAFWGSFSPVIASISNPGERERWFGFLGALRNAGFALGGLGAAVVVSIGTGTVYTLVVVLNALSYVLSFVLLLSMETERPAAVTRPSQGGSGWGVVLRDRPYLALVATNLTYAMSGNALNVAMPVYFIDLLGLPGWVAGAVFTINTVLIGFGQGLVVNAMTGSVRSRILVIGGLMTTASYLILLAASWTTVAVGVAVVLFGAVVYTGGELACGPVLVALSTDAARADLRGRYTSLFQLSWNVASTIAPALLTFLLSRGTGETWLFMAAVAGSGVVASAVLRRVMPLAAAEVVDTRPAPPEPRDAVDSQAG
jgi:MFS family permease